MGATDALIARYQGEIEERSKFVDGLVEGAEKDNRDLTEQEMGLLTRARERIQFVTSQVEPLRETAQIAHDSRERTKQIAEQFAAARNPDAVPDGIQYRSAGEYIIDVWRSGLGHPDAERRLDMFTRAAAHQTTGDNPGLLPDSILGPVVNFVDQSRPLVNALGPRNLPSGSWSRPQVTQHTSVGVQATEKTELVSQKMVIGKLPVTAVTIGGYVNVSRQDVDWTQPQVLDIIVNDLAGQYALASEGKAVTDLLAAAPAGPTIPTGVPTAADVSGALWGAAATVIAATAGQGRIIAVAPPELMGTLGPLFPPVNPQDAQSSGFTVAAMGSGLAGSIAGIPVYVSGSLPADTILVLSTAAAEIYEDRIGPLQVVEPSVLGIQLAFAGYFADLVVLAAGLSKVIKAP